jgi:hypothetical protein
MGIHNVAIEHLLEEATTGTTTDRGIHITVDRQYVGREHEERVGFRPTVVANSESGTYFEHPRV